MDYYIEKIKMKNNAETFIDAYILYQNGYAVGYVRLNDNRNGTHGYAIRAIDQERLNQFQEEARRQFPNSENCYIRFLDLLYPMRKKEFHAKDMGQI